LTCNTWFLIGSQFEPAVYLAQLGRLGSEKREKEDLNYSGKTEWPAAVKS